MLGTWSFLILHVNCTIVFNFTDPDIMKKLQVDRGAIRFVLAGANIMCPGLTSPGGVLDEEVGAECPVVLPLCFVDCL
jgi:predicted RNA-binding protein (TIGR00451 family)